MWTALLWVNLFTAQWLLEEQRVDVFALLLAAGILSLRFRLSSANNAMAIRCDIEIDSSRSVRAARDGLFVVMLYRVWYRLIFYSCSHKIIYIIYYTVFRLGEDSMAGAWGGGPSNGWILLSFQRNLMNLLATIVMCSCMLTDLLSQARHCPPTDGPTAPPKDHYLYRK